MYIYLSIGILVARPDSLAGLVLEVPIQQRSAITSLKVRAQTRVHISIRRAGRIAVLRDFQCPPAKAIFRFGISVAVVILLVSEYVVLGSPGLVSHLLRPRGHRFLLVVHSECCQHGPGEP